MTRAYLIQVFTLVATLGWPHSITAQSKESPVAAAAARVAPQMVEYRHMIHRHPELGNREVKTAELVAKHLRSLGLEVQTGIAHTGVVGLLRGKRPGPTVAVRADMDALPVTEATDLPFRSTDKAVWLGRETGVAHACGHDLHVAIQLGVASLLSGMRDTLAGTVMFIFQPAEEGVPPGERGGAKMMVEEGVFSKVKPDAVIGLHVNGSAPDDIGDYERLGVAAYTPGPAMASSTRFRATIQGRQSHGAAPHTSIDPVVVASEIVLALQTIRSRNLPPLTPSVVTVGIIRGGNRNNIIPAEVELEGTIRSFETPVQDTIETRMREIFEGITRAYRAKFTLEFDRTHPVTVNDTLLTARLVPTLERVLGRSNVQRRQPITGAEDFSYFAREVPGFFFHLGAVPVGRKSGGHHTPTFYADDGAIPIGIRAMTSLVLDFLATPKS
ncbi:MAG TPA: amidohydrolase [Gemmatimonadales bacterium]|nr:amidohydrolase [Gemmatimonadales bacterium]